VKATSHLELSFETESAWELLYNSSVSATELAPAKLQKLHCTCKRRREEGRALEFKFAALLDLAWGPRLDFDPLKFCAQKVEMNSRPHMRRCLA
jgi:hypothetical protein